jgi:hypothetical protein
MRQLLKKRSRFPRAASLKAPAACRLRRKNVSGRLFF